MKEEQPQVQAPDISGEEMKMPENLNATEGSSHSTAPLNGIIIVILVLLLVFILGGLYIWFSQLMLNTDQSVAPTNTGIERPTAAENNEPESTTAEAAVEAAQAMSTSDEIAAIEADIEATDLDALDAELNAIDAELEAALTEEF